MKKTNWFLFLQIIICLFVFSGCQEKKPEEEPAPEYVFPEEYYPDYTTINYANGRGYEIKNENSNKLIITLDGGQNWASS